MACACRFFKEAQAKEKDREGREVLTNRDCALMWNLMPGSYEEAKQLVPGLANASQDTVATLVNFLNEKRSLTHGGTRMMYEERKDN